MKQELTLYKNMSDASEIVACESGKTVAEALEGIDLSNAVVLVNGKRKNPDYKIKKDDVIMVRVLPSATAVAIIGLVLGVAAGIVTGIMAYKQKQRLASLQDEMNKMKRNTNNDSSTNLPFVKGATNSLATEKTMPFICGRHLFTPYLLGKPVYEIGNEHGKEQFVEEALEIGFAPVVINSINVDDIKVVDFQDAQEPQQICDYFDGNFFSDSDFFEIVQNIGANEFSSALSCLNVRMDSNEINAQIPYQSDVQNGDSNELTFTLDEHARNVEICIDFPNGLYSTNDDGSRGNGKASVWAEYSLDGGQTFVNEVDTRGCTVDTISERLDHALLPTIKITHTDKKTVSRKGDLLESGTFEGASRNVIGLRQKELAERYPGKIIEYSNDRFSELNRIQSIRKYFIDYSVYDVVTEVLSEEVLVSRFDKVINMCRTIESRYIIGKTFSAEDISELHRNHQKAVVFRVRLVASKESRNMNTCYVKYYQSKCYDPKIYKENETLADCPILEDRERKLSAMLGIRIKATDSTAEKLKKINVVCTGLARVFEWHWENGLAIGAWTEDKRPTRNPASWLLEILTSPTHQLSKFYDNEIDLDSFGEFYRYCESGVRDKNNNFIPLRFDYVITSKETKQSIIDKILEICGASLYVNLYGKLALAIDNAKPNAVCLLTSQNIKSIQNKKTFGRKSDAVRLTFINSENDNYKEDTIVVMRDVNKHDISELDSPADAVIRDLTVQGISTYKHAVWYARRLLAMEILRPKTVTVEIGREGVFFAPYSKVLLQTDSLKVGLGNGVVKSVKTEEGFITRLIVSVPITFPQSGDGIGFVVNHIEDDGAVPVSVAVGYVEGNNKEVTLVEPVAEGRICEGDTFAFGYLDNGNFTRITSPYLVMSVKPTESGASLELMDYNADVYKDVDIPDYVPNFSEKPKNVKGEIHYESVADAKDYFASLLKRDTTPPSVPYNLRGSSDTFGAVALQWNASADENGIYKYNIYRRPSLDVGATLIDSIGKSDDPMFIDERLERNKTYYYSVSAVDNYGNESERCEDILVASIVSTPPNPPRDIRAKAERDWIKITWKNPDAVSEAAFNTSRNVLYMSRDSGETWEELECWGGSHFYYFDRETDGYPEPEELSNWRFKVKSVSVYGVSSEEIEAENEDYLSSYKTWRIPEITATASASQNRILVSWKLENFNFYYNHLTFDIIKDGTTVAENLSNFNFIHYFHEYLERSDIENFAFKVVAKTGVDEREVEIDSIDTSDYKTYIVGTPEISAKAEKNGLDIKWSKTNDFYLTPTYELYLNDEIIFSSDYETEHFHAFADGEYPEKADFEDFDIKVKISTDANFSVSESAEIDTTEYLTHIPEVPELKITSGGRIASLSWNNQFDCYDFEGVFVQISKGYETDGNGRLTPISENLVWYAPALGLNPYESIENYKRGEAGGYLEVKGFNISFPLPLFGQDDESAENTPYYFRVKAKTKSGKTSDWTEPFFIEMKATSAYDVVKAWDFDPNTNKKVRLDGALGAKQIFVEELAAISANLGYINDGALHGDMYNYWAVNDTRLPDDSILWKGSFRVGGTEQYIKVTPRLERGTPTGEYDIEFVVGKYSISATGSTSIQGEDFIVYDRDGNIMFKTGPNGNLIAVDTGTYQGTNPVSFDFWTSPITNDVDYSKVPIGMYSRDDKIFICIINDAQTDRPSVTIAMVDSDNEQLVPVNSMTPDDGSSFYTNPFIRPDGTGIVFPLTKTIENQADGTSFSQISLVFYDAAANSFSEETVCNTEPLEDVFDYANMKTTSNGILLTKGRENQYFGLDGTNARFSLNVDNDKESKTLVYDSENEVYIIFQYWITTFVVKIDKTTNTVKHNNFLFINAEESNDALKPDHAVFAGHDDLLEHFIPYSPVIKDGKMYFFVYGAWMLDEGSSRKVPTYGFSKITSGIVRIDLDNVLWKDIDDESFGLLIRPDFYEWKEIPLNGMIKQAFPVDLDPNSLESFVFPYGEVPDGNAIGLEPVSERLFHVDYDSAADDEGSCFWHGNAITSENVTTLNTILYSLMFYGSFFMQKSLKVGNSFRVVLVTSLDFVVENLSYHFNSNIRLTTFHTEFAESLERTKAFNSGVGFTKVLYDEASQHYRYYLDPETGTPAFLEFDKHGNLDLPSLTRGPKGERGEKGEKGDTGDRGEKGEKGDDGTALIVPTNGFFYLSGDEEGNLWAHYADGSADVPSFEVDGDDNIFINIPD